MIDFLKNELTDYIKEKFENKSGKDFKLEDLFFLLIKIYNYLFLNNKTDELSN